MTPLLALCAGIGLAVTTPSAGAEQRPAPQRAAELERRGAALAERTAAAVRELYGLESQLARARAELDRMRAEQAALAGEQAAAAELAALARGAARSAEHELAQVVRTLYEAGGADPLAVLLGAESLDDALSRLEHLERSAESSRAIATQATERRAELRSVQRRLAERSARLAAAAKLAAAAERGLAGALDERRAYVAALRSELDLNAAQLATVQERARTAQARSQELAVAAPASAPAAAPAAAAVVVDAERPQAAPSAGLRPGQTLSVDAVAYSLPGSTASGLPVGRGVVAVDPTVIPLGTRMYVPGYGEAVAADVGSAVQGLLIDLWFPTLAEAQAWGRRTVTITIR